MSQKYPRTNAVKEAINHTEKAARVGNRCFVPVFKEAPELINHITYLPNGWGVAKVTVTPELALEMLQRNAENQRGEKKINIEKFAWDMVSGDWHLTHQGIAFDDHGTLFDGQNRLRAVIVAGVNVEMLVFFGIGKAGETKHMTVIDTHGVRTNIDAAKIMQTGARSHHLAVLNSMIRCGVPNGINIFRRMTQTVKMELLGELFTVIDDTIKMFFASYTGRTMGKGSVQAAVALASLSIPAEKIQRFVDVLVERDEVRNKGEGSVRSLRQFIQTRFGKSLDPHEAFMKTCKAIIHFVSGVDVGPSHLQRCSENPFPLPETVTLRYASLANIQGKKEAGEETK